jgi:hypothetical protein
VLVGGTEQAFTEFVRQVEPRLRESLVAALGAEAGREAITLGIYSHVGPTLHDEAAEIVAGLVL